MKSFFVAAAVFLAAFHTAAARADTDLTDLFQKEQTALKNVPGRHLKSLLTRGDVRAKPRPQSVKYTRSWIDSQPKAKGDDQWRCLAERK